MGGARRSPPASRPLLLALLLALTAASVRGDGVVPRLVLVFDASGSMWGEIDGRPKIDIARGVIRELLDDWDPRVELGLTVYGHRREGDCSDIERLIPLGPPDPEATLRAVEAITPRGKTPIARSIEQAAQEARYLDDPATLILVTDGRETCGVDPCVVARELEERGVSFTAHVIGFDIGDRDRAELECLANATGGMYLAATDARGLRDALDAAVAEATAAVAERDGVWLAAALAEGREPLAESVKWTIRSARDRRVVHRATGPSLFLPLAPGRYVVTAELEGVSGRLQLQVEEGEPASHVVPLDAGRLSLSAVERSLAEPLADGISWEVRRVGVGSDPHVRRSEQGAVDWTLPAGRYRVVAAYDGSRVTREVTLRPGETRRERLRFGSGRAALRAVLRPGMLPIEDPVVWEVRKDPTGPLLVMEQRATTLLSLEDGRYWVTARYGETTVGQWIDVQAGATRTHTLDLGAGTLRVFGSLPPPGGPILDPIEWQVQGAEDGAVVARSDSAAYSFVLPAGRYRISGTFAGAHASREVAVRPGETDSLGLTFKQGDRR